MSSNEVRPTGIVVRIARHPLAVMIWAVLSTVILAFPIGFLFYALMGPVSGPSLSGSVVKALASTLALLGVSRWIERRRPSEVGFAPEHAVRGALLGGVAGVVLISTVIGLLALAGAYQAVWAAASPQLLLGSIMALVFAAWFEEVFFRAILFRCLEGWGGSGAALLGSSLLFGLAHLGNPNAGWVPAIAIAIEAGVMLGAVWMWTRSLWAVWGLHFAWNWTQGGLFGAPVSGLPFSGLLKGSLHGDPLWTGGTFGPEAGLVAVLVCGTAGGLALAHVIRQGGWRPSPLRFFSGPSAPVVVPPAD